MKNALSWTLILMLGGVKGQASSPGSTPSPKDKDPLILTPYILNNQIAEARKASEVQMFMMANVMAYSGFITVDNSTCNSNLFFLFLVSQKNDSRDPLMLWTMGGPGLSAMFGELLQNGPLAFDIEKRDLSIRNNTLQKLANIIYLDLPVGAGYSFTHRNDCYSKNLDDINDHVEEFLRQFLMLFPEYICREFYVGGESYAARYSVSIANRMLNKSNDRQLILKGVIGGNGFLGPILDLADSSNFMYQLSMVDKKGRDTFSEKFQMMKNMSLNPARAFDVVIMLSQTIFTNDTSHTLYQNVTLYNDYLSPLLTERSLSLLGCFLLLYNDSKIRDALHIGPSVRFQFNNSDMLMSLASDYLENISTVVSRVLDETNVLLYTGQLDPLFPSVNQRAFLSTLQWKEADAYKNATRIPWKPTNESNGFAGFLTRTRNFTYAVLLGMSHYGAIDKPNEVYYLIKEFMRNHSGSTDRAIRKKKKK